MTERWRDVVGFEDYYCVSNRGRVMRNNTGRILKQYPTRKGYLQINLCKNGLMYNFRVHRLVLLAFVGLPKDDQETNHKDGVKSNNRVRNLEWVTCKENNQHKIHVLKLNVGETHHCWGKFGSDSVHSKEYVVTSPQGEKYNIVGLKKFCRDNNLDAGTMSSVASGKYKKHKGWGCQHV